MAELEDAHYLRFSTGCLMLLTSADSRFASRSVHKAAYLDFGKKGCCIILLSFYLILNDASGVAVIGQPTPALSN
jgi:hypothetical protein